MKKIAIIEDTSVLQYRLENLLTKNRMLSFESYHTNILSKSYLEFIHKEVGLFIIDLENHNNNGLDLIKKIRHFETNENTPIIALSKHADISVLKQVVKAGCNDFIIKPFDDASLIYKVKRLLGEVVDSADSPNKFIPSVSGPVEPHVSTKELEIPLLWDKEFIINIKEIDDEHKSLIDQYEALYQKMKAGEGHDYYNELLLFLNDYVHTHFSHEEKIHEAYKYPLKSEHQSIHEDFKNSVLKIAEDRQEKSVNDMDLIKISLFIKNWLIHHILIEDMKFGHFVTGINSNSK